MGGAIPYARILRCPARGEICFTLLGPGLECWDTHWDGTQDRPCLLAVGGNCPVCEDGRAPRPKWYAWAQAWPKRGLVVVEVTNTAVRYCPDLQAIAGDCRGYRLRLTRGKGRQGGVRAEVSKVREHGDHLPRVLCPVGAYLARMWEIRLPAGQDGVIRVEPPANPAPIPLPADKPAAAAKPAHPNPPNPHADSEAWRQLREMRDRLGRMPNGEQPGI